MTHYKNSLLNKSGEGHIDTGIKIIIGIVIGALILGGLYALFDSLVMPKLNDKVQGMMQYGENSPSYRYGATLSSLQYSYNGSTWMNADIPDIGKNAIVTQVLNTSEKDFSLAIINDANTIYVIKTEDNGVHWSVAYNAGNYMMGGKPVEYQLYQNSDGTYKMMIKIYFSSTETTATGYLFKSADGRTWQRDGNPLFFE